MRQTFWFKLINQNQYFQNEAVQSITIENFCFGYPVLSFIQAILPRCRKDPKLANVEIGQLDVFVKGNFYPVYTGTSVQSLQNSLQNPFTVVIKKTIVVPKSTNQAPLPLSQAPVSLNQTPVSSVQKQFKSTMSQTSKNFARTERWQQLNYIFEQDVETEVSQQFADEVSHVFDRILYSQVFLKGPNEQPNQHSNVPVIAGKLMANLGQEQPFDRKAFLRNATPQTMLPLVTYWVMAATFGHPETTVEFKTQLDGDELYASVVFDIVVKRGSQWVCVNVVEVDEIDAGMYYNMLGCEVAVENSGASEVLGIVTNGLDWVFVSSGNEKIVSDQSFISVQDITLKVIEGIDGRLLSLFDTK